MPVLFLLTVSVELLCGRLLNEPYIIIPFVTSCYDRAGD